MILLASKSTPTSSPIGLNLILCYTQHTSGPDNHPSQATCNPNPDLFLCLSPRSHTITHFSCLWFNILHLDSTSSFIFPSTEFVLPVSSAFPGLIPGVQKSAQSTCVSLRVSWASRLSTPLKSQQVGHYALANPSDLSKTKLRHSHQNGFAFTGCKNTKELKNPTSLVTQWILVSQMGIV